MFITIINFLVQNYIGYKHFYSQFNSVVPVKQRKI